MMLTLSDIYHPWLPIASTKMAALGQCCAVHAAHADHQSFASQSKPALAGSNSKIQRGILRLTSQLHPEWQASPVPDLLESDCIYPVQSRRCDVIFRLPLLSVNGRKGRYPVLSPPDTSDIAVYWDEWQLQPINRDKRSSVRQWSRRPTHASRTSVLHGDCSTSAKGDNLLADCEPLLRFWLHPYLLSHTSKHLIVKPKLLPSELVCTTVNSIACKIRT